MKRKNLEFRGITHSDKPIPNDKVLESIADITAACISYPKSVEQENIAFADYSGIEEKTQKKILRIGIAHELAHIILMGWFITEVLEKDEINKEIQEREQQTLKKLRIRRSPSEEELASVVGMIMLAEKCHFHLNEYPKYLYNDLDEIIKQMP